MVENFELSRQQSGEIETGHLFSEVMRDLKPETRSEAAKAVDSLDVSDRRTFNQVVDSMKSIMDRIAQLPESVRAEFLSANEKMDGPVYDLLRSAQKGN
jgi:hypothetical protein